MSEATTKGGNDMRFTKWGVFILSAVFLLSLFPAHAQSVELKKDVSMPKTMIISGGVGAGSTSTLIVLWAVKRINAVFPNISIRHIPGGNKDGIVKASAGTVAIGKTEVGITKRAWNGLPPEFKGKQLRDARLMNCLPTPTCIVGATLKNRDDIKTAKDLYNKKIGVGMTTSITHVMAEAALRAYGITPDSIKKNGGVWSYGKWSQQFDMLSSGTLDCVIMGTPQPYSAALTVDKGFGKGLKLVSWGAEGIAAQQKAYTDNPIRTIPANTYSGQKEPVKAFGTTNLFAVHKSLPNGVVYNFLYALFQDDGKSYREIAGPFKNLDVYGDALASKPLPWHPGAEQYWRDRGRLK